jgi:hypothetical protein
MEIVLGQKYVLGKKVGHGAFGEIYEGGLERVTCREVQARQLLSSNQASMRAAYGSRKRWQASVLNCYTKRK